jgi:hypothetical protein
MLRDLGTCEMQIQLQTSSKTLLMGSDAPDTLVSEHANYTKLQELLSLGKWKEADTETWHLLCLAQGKPIGTYLFESDITRVPCEDFLMLDRLWMSYSQGRFGFSIKKEIYEDVEREYKHYCDRIGWRIGLRNGRSMWITYDEIIFDLKAPRGHLPWIAGLYGNSGACGQEALLAAIVNKVDNCNNPQPPKKKW